MLVDPDQLCALTQAEWVATHACRSSRHGELQGAGQGIGVKLELDQRRRPETFHR
jgi:hypothetical protein